MSNILKVEIKTVYGKDLIYPRCKRSILFTKLMGTKTISEDNIMLIKWLGFDFETINRNVPDLQKSI